MLTLMIVAEIVFADKLPGCLVDAPGGALWGGAPLRGVGERLLLYPYPYPRRTFSPASRSNWLV